MRGQRKPPEIATKLCRQHRSDRPGALVNMVLQYNKKSDDVVGRMSAQAISGAHYVRIQYHRREVSNRKPSVCRGGEIAFVYGTLTQV